MEAVGQRLGSGGGDGGDGADADGWAGAPRSPPRVPAGAPKATKRRAGGGGGAAAAVRRGRAHASQAAALAAQASQAAHAQALAASGGAALAELSLAEGAADGDAHEQEQTSTHAHAHTHTHAHTPNHAPAPPPVRTHTSFLRVAVDSAEAAPSAALTPFGRAMAERRAAVGAAEPPVSPRLFAPPPLGAAGAHLRVHADARASLLASGEGAAGEGAASAARAPSGAAAPAAAAALPPPPPPLARDADADAIADGVEGADGVERAVRADAPASPPRCASDAAPPRSAARGGAAARMLSLPPPPPLFGDERFSYGAADVAAGNVNAEGIWVARTGTNFPMAHVPPPHVRPPGADAADATALDPAEPMLAGGRERERLRARMALQDIERLANPSDVLNRVVYDSIEPPPAPGGDVLGGVHATVLAPPANMNRPRRATSNADAAPGAGDRASGAGDCAPASPPNRFMTHEALPTGMLPPYYEPLDEADTTLVFESRFESGNLRRAIQVYETEYDLILRPDINTRGHTQWFYFAVRNARKGVRYKLNIINLVKPESLYQQGMQPVMYSEREARATGASWRRAGDSICYYQNAIKRRSSQHYYTLTMTIEVPHDDDTVYLAHCYPYTFTDLQRYLKAVSEDPRNAARCRRRVLCTTLAGNPVDMLTITSFGCDPEDLRARRGIVLSGRVHPGETNASWMVKGAMDFLLGDSLEARLLRDKFVFKVIPMLNPDGVINGNYRCSLAGVDLNRAWLDPSRKLHPPIYHTKVMMRRLMEDRPVLMYADFHGHSRKKNIFMYGCENKVPSAGSAQAPSPSGRGAPPASARLHERIFPALLARAAPELFSLEDCSFKVQRSKESTARVVSYREYGLVNSFTVEASFAGSTKGAMAGYHFSARHLEELGRSFCEALLAYCNPDQVAVNSVMRDLGIFYAPRTFEVGAHAFPDAPTSDVSPVGGAALAALVGAEAAGIGGEDTGDDSDLGSSGSDTNNGASASAPTGALSGSAGGSHAGANANAQCDSSARRGSGAASGAAHRLKAAVQAGRSASSGGAHRSVGTSGRREGSQRPSGSKGNAGSSTGSSRRRRAPKGD